MRSAWAVCGVVMATLFAAAGASAGQQGGSDAGYVPTLPKNYLPQEVKSPFEAFGGWRLSRFRWHELMGAVQPPAPPSAPASNSGTAGSTVIPGLKFKLPGPIGGTNTGPGIVKPPGTSSKSQCALCPAWAVFGKIGGPFRLCKHQLKWSSAWTQLPLDAAGIRRVGPAAVGYGHANTIYALLYVGSHWSLGSGKKIRVYAVSTADPLTTYVDSDERTWWFSHMAGIDLKQKEILREFLRPGASAAKLNQTMAGRLNTWSGPQDYFPGVFFVYDALEDRAHVGGHSVDIQEFDNVRSNLALLRAIGKSRPIASGYIWNGVSTLDAAHFIHPPTAGGPPPQTSWTTYGLSPLHVALAVTGDSMKPIWNEYGKELWSKLCWDLGLRLLKARGYSWEWQSWGSYLNQNGGSGLFQ